MQKKKAIELSVKLVRLFLNLAIEKLLEEWELADFLLFALIAIKPFIIILLLGRR